MQTNYSFNNRECKLIFIFTLSLALFFIFHINEKKAVYAETTPASSGPKINERLYEIDSLINQRQSEIEKIRSEIDKYKNDLKFKEDEYDSTRERLEVNEKKSRSLYEEKLILARQLKINTENLLRKKKLLDDRIKAIYKDTFRKKIGYFFKCESFADFYVNIFYLTRMIKADSEFIADISKKVSVIKTQREELNYKIKEIDLLNANSRDYEKSLKNSSAKMGKNIDSLVERELNIKKELSVLFLEKERLEKDSGVELERNRMAAEEADREKKRTAAKALAAAEKTEETSVSAAKIDPASLVFIWPLKESKTVLSFYGTQKDPKYNVNYFNSGIDVSGAFAEEVLASADGTIKYKGEMKSVGKLLIIDHGGNMTTLYSHLGLIEVGMGQKVKQGETIGRLKEKNEMEAKPFLHFEIRTNGAAKDPMDYL